VSPPDRYIGGEYVFEISAIESNSAVTTTATVNIHTNCSIEISGPDAPGMESFDTLIPELMNDWGLFGGSVAVVKDGRLVFAHGYGMSDNSCESVVQPETRFRIASLSKPITSVGILMLKEDNQISLDDKAFDILDHLKPDSGSIDSRINDITIRDLLHHAAGWDIDELGFDPMFRSEEIAKAEGKMPPASSETIIRFMLKQDLNFDPGTKYAYSNLGYAVLGHIIEEITGDSYESYIFDTMLSEMGISRMQIGNTRLENRDNRESRYFGRSRTDSVFPDQDGVPFPYGGFYLQAMAAHGGWIASTVDLMRFIVHVDNRDSVGDVLETATIDTMTERPDIPKWQGSDYYYSKGWFVRPISGNWWHSGSLPGTTSIIVRAGQTEENLAWAAVFNSRPEDWQTFNSELDSTLWNAVENVTKWPAHDLFSDFD
jgi:N-acyl-D-amino-acid deacylase